MKKVFVLGLAFVGAWSAPKRMLFELNTSRYCSNCPRAPLLIEEFGAQNPAQVILVEHHCVDVMTSKGSYEIASLISGQPGLLIDRSTNHGTVGESHDQFAVYKSQLQQAAPLEIELEHTWDSVTRKLSGNVVVKFEQAVSKSDLQVGMMLIQDSVANSQSANYAQLNKYNSSDLFPELRGAGTAIKGYAHHAVHRDDLIGGSVHGQSGVISANPAAGSVFKIPFTYTVPQRGVGNAANQYVNYWGGPSTAADEVGFSPAYLRLVPFVGSGTATVLNSRCFKLIPGADGKAIECQVPDAHTPVALASGTLELLSLGDGKWRLGHSDLSFSVYGCAGNLIRQGVARGGLLDLAALPTGAYFVKAGHMARVLVR